MYSELEKYAKENKVPIILPDGIEYIEKYIRNRYSYSVFSYKNV